ncbi:Holliday junction branch migration protein RuvA [Clostridium sp. chh4-2]|uniref:Holliday junction branch migration protein RuvA n=1 Tax=Clostridium sp. chh4-2 TaxID=2067550 RepID=UPI000CCDD100|nr:Holliday junction branch migration protein RuvA [Clostridium sp. chh4-2]PNV64083.1 Holliday junction branch migration protein RuvA [Clostridium sp. chh4-2]
MISYIKGLLVETFEDTIVVEAGNIGYNIHVPLSLLERLPKVGNEVKVFTYFQVREDAMSLYGFLNRQDLDMFKQLIGVNGIGPKGALGVLSTLTPDSLRMAIISGDAKAISKAPGIGVKTAQRVILDLKDRVHIEDMLPQEAETEALGGSLVGQTGKEAMEALVALGYSGSEAAKAVRQVEITDEMTVEDVLKASLKHLSFL